MPVYSIKKYLLKMSDSYDENDASLKMDGREPYDWQSKYPSEAWRKIKAEMALVFILFLLSFIIIYCTWMNCLCSILGVSKCDVSVFNKYAYYSFSGLLGGVVFGMKFLYRAVARGYWNEDRFAWRLLSPFIAFVVSFIVGTLVESNLIKSDIKIATSAVISIGFLSGYFADEAVGKMYEIASILFGKVKK